MHSDRVYTAMSAKNCRSPRLQRTHKREKGDLFPAIWTSYVSVLSKMQFTRKHKTQDAIHTHQAYTCSRRFTILRKN
jgi:hypothetical protein